jgi:cell division transport system permease protein
VAVSLDYVTRETASNLWRNRLMTVAAVLTVAVSLSLVGASLLLRQGVSNATSKWQHGVNVLVWLRPGVSTNQRATIENQLHQLPYVRTCTYRSQLYDFNEAKRLLSPQESQTLTPGTMPSSLRCVLNNPAQAQAIARQFSKYPGVQQPNGVDYPSQAIRNMEQVTHILQLVFLALALILLLSASVLILNTIRLAIFARRREVSVMKLVGATNWFVRVPFMCEGVIQGVLGAAVAALVVLGLHWLLDAIANPTNVFSQMRLSSGEVFNTTLVVVLIGVIIGSVGSALGIRRFLDT